MSSAGTTKPCPKCGQLFLCCAASVTQCHCAQVALTDELRAYLASHWADCLCPKCLAEFVQSNEVKTPLTTWDDAAS